MALELVPAESQHVNEIGRICFEAFKEIDDKHRFPRGFPTIDVALKFMSMLVERKDFYGVVALMDGNPVGSNFLSLMDPVAGIISTTVDPAYQGQNIGRALTQDVIDYAHRNKIEQVRLMQASYNVASLSLMPRLDLT